MKEYFEIVDVTAREILDSRGNPTVEVEAVSYTHLDVYKRQSLSRASGSMRRKSAWS